MRLAGAMVMRRAGLTMGGRRGGASKSAIRTRREEAVWWRSRNAIRARPGHRRGERRPAFGGGREDAQGQAVRLRRSISQRRRCALNVPSGIRTHDLRIKSPLLYQLSYRDDSESI